MLHCSKGNEAGSALARYSGCTQFRFMTENRTGSAGDEQRARESDVAFDDEDSLIQKPDDFEENYEEFSDEADAKPDDRRRDPLRHKW
jgi:hypothetical protein